MTIEIPPEYEQFVRNAIDSGGFSSEAELIAEAIRLLRERKLYELRKDIDAAVEQLDRGEGIEVGDEAALREFFDDIKVRGRKRLEAKQDAR